MCPLTVLILNNVLSVYFFYSNPVFVYCNWVDTRWQKYSTHLHTAGLWARTACSYRSAQAATMLEFMYHSRIVLSVGGSCVVHDPKPPFHSHNWLSFGKFQDTERFLIHCERHFSSRLHPSGGTWKYAKAPITKKTCRDSLTIDMLLSAVSVLVVVQSSSEIPEGLMNNPVWFYFNIDSCSLVTNRALKCKRFDALKSGIAEDSNQGLSSARTDISYTAWSWKWCHYDSPKRR